MKSIILSLLFCCTACFVWAQTPSVDSSTASRSVMIDVSNKLKVYPNPSSNWLFVTHPVINRRGVQLLISDMNGKTVLKADVKIQTMQSILNISSLITGVYVITWSNGNERGTAMLQKN
ncbi:MAG: T9SS type A sorting domain-containing protein [Chitinophagaceae bacterium]|nr:T9SS type A sorting domain-containing protein [Chitinophagaceae bacterium]